MAKTKIAILGGGWGSISTALYLTDPKNPNRDQYDITIYQLGWRLGGKGASGRRGPEARIEEHGLHIWMGFYDNSFHAIQGVYEEVQPIYRRITNYPKNPFKTWTDAFKPHSFILFAEQIEAQWKLWGIQCPTNDLVPGKDHRQLSVADHLKMICQFLHRTFRSSHLSKRPSPHKAKIDLLSGLLERLEIRLEADLLTFGEMALVAALDLLERFDKHNHLHHSTLLAALEHFVDWLKSRMDEELGFQLEKDDTLRRIYIALELGGTIAIGLLRDGILTHERALDALDVYDFREWLRKHGASDWVIHSGPVQGLYDLVFAYENGEIGRPNYAAGVAVRSLVCIGLHYKGAIFWKMQAGMGDTIFAPAYLVLKERGVKFSFFNRVKKLRLSSDQKRVQSIDLGIQATLNRAEYDPLVIVKDLPCWPAEPRYEQLKEGDALQKGRINLESFYTPWADVGSRTLECGRDFDCVVLGISIGALPFIAQELAAANPVFDRMLKDVKTVRTQAFQLWFKDSLKDLGWTEDSPVLDAYLEPMNTWADMSQVLDKETWPDGSVGQVSYFCGPMEGGIPPEQTTPELCDARVYENALSFAQSALGFLLPNAAAPDNPNGIDFRHLADLQDGQFVERFRRQFFRANIDPAERYVLSLKGTTESRLAANQSGFENLILAGDWTRNGFNAGCIEATTLSGIQASFTLSGYPIPDQMSVY